MKFKAIIFDMDGVIVDTEQCYYDRRKTFLLDTYNITLDHLPPKFFIGGNMKKVWHEVLRDDYDKYDIDKLAKEYLEYKKNHPLPYQQLLFEGIKETLQQIDGIAPIAIASNSSMADIDRCLKENDLELFFSHKLTGDDCQKSKPAPEIYLKTAQLLEVKPEECLVIEDSEKGIIAGKSAGMTVWAIKDKHYGLDQSAADLLIESVQAIPELLLET